MGWPAYQSDKGLPGGILGIRGVGCQEGGERKTSMGIGSINQPSLPWLAGMCQAPAPGTPPLLPVVPTG